MEYGSPERQVRKKIFTFFFSLKKLKKVEDRKFMPVKLVLNLIHR